MYATLNSITYEYFGPTKNHEENFDSTDGISALLTTFQKSSYIRSLPENNASSGSFVVY